MAEDEAAPGLDRDLVRARARAGLFGTGETPLVAGRYRVIDRLGEGGMGVVYVVQDTKLHRRVALKVAQTGTDPQDRARMTREALALAQLAHPNVVTVFDVGEHKGELYVAMEFIQGETLDRWVNRARPSAREILRVMVAAGRGLEAAHARGLVHRDFKPENVMIARDGAVKVLDFGLVRRIQVAASADGGGASPLERGITTTGNIVGTPLYMSPEQFMGGPIDVRVDQYSFCKALYHLLFGKLPHQASNLEELVFSVLKGSAAPPPRTKGVTSRVRRVVMRGMSPLPEERFPSMAALLGELRREGTPVPVAWIAGGTAAVVAAAFVGALVVTPPTGSAVGPDGAPPDAAVVSDTSSVKSPPDGSRPEPPPTTLPASVVPLWQIVQGERERENIGVKISHQQRGGRLIVLGSYQTLRQAQRNLARLGREIARDARVYYAVNAYYALVIHPSDDGNVNTRLGQARAVVPDAYTYDARAFPLALDFEASPPLADSPPR